MDQETLGEYYKRVRAIPKRDAAYDHDDSPYRSPHVLLNKTSLLPPCGCTVDGYGTILEPIVIRFCPLHEAAPKMHLLLWEAAEDSGKVTLKWVEQARSVLTEIDGE